MGSEQKIIPDEWDLKTLGDIADVSSGGSAPQGDKYFDGESPFVRVQHIDQDTDSINRYDLITDEAVKKYKLKKYKAGTIVFPKSGASIYLEKRAVLPVDAYIASHLCAVNSAQRDVYQDFLFYSLKHILLSKGKADGYPTLNLSEVKRVAIPVPAFEEQKKVVRVLSVIKKAIEQQEKIIKKTKELKRSLMHRLFTYGLRGEELKETVIGFMPKSWDANPFESLCENVKDSWNPGQYLNGIYVGLEHIESGNSVLKSFGTAQNLRSSKFIFSVGDILYGKLRPYLDKAVITNKKGICSTDILVFRPKNNVPAGFIVNLIHWSPFIEYAKKTTHGVNHPRTSWNSIRNFTCGIPQYEEQQEIAGMLLSIDEKIERERQREYLFRALFKSMLQLLMTGQVRVKDIDFGEISV